MNLKEFQKRISNNINDELKITIVSPYLSNSFIKNLRDIFSPKELLIVTDKLAELKAEKIKAELKAELEAELKAEKIKAELEAELEAEKIKENKIVTLRLAQCGGIVHAKLFLFTFVHANTNEHVNIFLWGSCNATKFAFHENAELYSWCNVPNTEDGKKLLGYFKNLSLPKQTEIKELEIKLDSINIVLPAFSLVEPKDNFDKWLEEGRFIDLRSYNFIEELQYRLLKKDERKDSAAQKTDFKYGDRSTLTLKKFKKDAPKIQPPKLKDFSISTIYGNWIPKNIFDWYKEEDNIKIISIEIDKLIDYMKTNRDDLIKEFIENIKGYADELGTEKLEDYFKEEALFKGNTELNIEHFEKYLEEQIEKYIEKYEQLKKPFKDYELPSIRFYRTQWDNFAESFILSVSINLSKKTNNKLSKKLKKFTTDKRCPKHDDMFNSVNWKISESNKPENILKQLRDRNDWEIIRLLIKKECEESLNKHKYNDLKTTNEDCSK